MEIANTIRSELEAYRDMLSDGLISEDAHKKLVDSTIRAGLKSHRGPGGVGDNIKLEKPTVEHENRSKRYEHLHWELLKEQVGGKDTVDAIKKSLLPASLDGRQVHWQTDRPSFYKGKGHVTWRWKSMENPTMRVKIEKSNDSA